MPIRAFSCQEMPTKKTPLKRKRGRPAVVKPVRDLRVGLNEDTEERFLRYRDFMEAQTPGLVPSDSALARALFQLGLAAWEREHPQTTITAQELTTTKS